MGPEPLLQRRHALVRLLRSHGRRDVRKLRLDVEVVRPGFGPGDELLDAAPEGSGLSEKVLASSGAWPSRSASSPEILAVCAL
jgi:hypothetical protein